MTRSSPHPFLPLPEEVLPVGVIAGATIGAGVLLIFFFIALLFFLYRRRKGSEYSPAAWQACGRHREVGAARSTALGDQKRPAEAGRKHPGCLPHPRS